MSQDPNCPRFNQKEHSQNPESQESESALDPTAEEQERQVEEEVKYQEEDDETDMKNEEDDKEEDENGNKEGKEEHEAESSHGDQDKEEENVDEEDGYLSSVSFSSCDVSLPTLSPPSPFSSSSSSSSYSLFQDIEEMGEPAVSMLTLSQRAQNFTPAFMLGTYFNDESGYQEEEGAGGTSEDSESMLKILLKEKVTDLVFLLIHKYGVKEPITKEEMLALITKEYEKYFPVIFSEARKCLELTFGIDIKEDDPVNSSYVIVNSLNLTYNSMMSDADSMPRNAFLIIILGIIFIEGNCMPEERIWEFLKMLGVYEGEEHFICGEPRDFLIRDLVQQNYLEYQQVPNSHPPHYVFLWGARAHAETTKLKVLEFLAKINKCEATSFSVWYEEALRDEAEKINDSSYSADRNLAMWVAER